MLENGGLEEVEALKALNENTRESKDAKEQMLENGGLEEVEDEIPTLLHDPASEAAIAALEKKLAIKLPEDYKSFLRASNGFGGSWNGTAFDPPLYPAEEACWDDNSEEYQIMLDLIECQIHYFIDYDTWPKVGRAITIGQEDTCYVWLIPPTTVAKVRDAYLALVESEESSAELKQEITNSINSFCGSIAAFKKCEWCVVKWQETELEGFPSFEAYMAEKLRASELS